jgi:hypothetical protein
MMTRQQRTAGFSILVVSCVALGVVGCGDGGGDGSERQAGIAEDLPCAFYVSDTWTFDVDAGQQVEIAIDTVSVSTAADLGFWVSCEGSGFEGRDEQPCSFAPPEGGCPATSFVAERTGSCLLSVYYQSGVPSCRDATAAEYLLDVKIEGASTLPTLVYEFPDSLPPVPTLTDSEDVTACGAGAVDAWRFDVVAGETVVIAAESADQETAAALALNVACGGAQLPPFSVPCTFPPPSGFSGCPLVTFDATSDATCVLTVGDYGDCADFSTARYRLGVERDGASAALDLTADDFKPTPPGTFTESGDVTPCLGWVQDLWEFDVLAGETVLVAVDTVDKETAADLNLYVTCGGDELSYFFTAPCSFPSSQGSWCPGTALFAPSDATCTVIVGGAYSCTDFSRARYRLGVERDGVPAALTLTDDNFGAPTPPAFTDFDDITPCDAGVVDAWRFDVLAWDTVTVAVDTLDHETAADLALEVVCGDQTMLIADDTLPCTFPPAAFGCPAGSFEPYEDGTCTVVVRSFGSCSDPRTARYRVGVERAGASADLTLIRNDEPSGVASSSQSVSK